MASERLRIDKWLWAARFFKTRSLATQAVEAGRVRSGGERLKPAREVRIGDLFEITRGDERMEVMVRALSPVRGSATAAQALYEETQVSRQRREERLALKRLQPEPAAERKGRPTKRDGRELRRLSQQHRGDDER